LDRNYSHYIRCGNGIRANERTDEGTAASIMKRITLRKFVLACAFFNLAFSVDANVHSTSPEDTSMVQWRVTELAFTSEKSYQDCFNDVELNVVFTHADTSFEMPAFWNGGNQWLVRFAPDRIGDWTYQTFCTDETNTGLHNKVGQLTCAEYRGTLDIYRRGFVKTVPGKRYFTYDDDSPFFYLGDTHWRFLGNTLDNFKTIIDKRVEQGFTVIQSEPFRVKYDLSDGVTDSDLYYFSKLDERFQYVADKGLVHANAQLIFVAELGPKRAKYPDAYLEKLCRYWVARYSTYPVMWTTAQECDNDYYYMRGKQKLYDAESNPWKVVAKYMQQYDPYKHPQTAHMEGSRYTIASGSSFRDLPGHSWFAAQWAPEKNQQLNFNIPKDFWNNGQGKPSVNYEGHYDHLWTNHFGARMQGWTAYLNGMYGHGYGAIDIWLYDSTYDMKNPTTRGGITITVEDKQTKWDESLEFPSGYQMGHMHEFFRSMAWWNLIPRFDDPEWFTSDGSWYSLASIASDLYVAYFYNNTHNRTGTIKNLDDQVTYRAQWYNPRNGQYTPLSSSVIPSSGSWVIPEKPDSQDWVLLLTHDEEGLSEKIQGRWSLEENGKDSVGDSHGILYGDPEFIKEEVMEGSFAVSFDGIDDHVSIDDHLLLGDMDQFSFSFWVKIKNHPVNYSMILGEERAYRLLLNANGTFSWVVATENNPWYSSGTLISGPWIEKDQWNHVVVGYDGSSTFLYVNGELEAHSGGNLSGRVVANNRRLTFAKGNGSTVENFDGALDDVRYFKRMLSGSSVNRLFSLYPIDDTTVAPKVNTITPVRN